MPAYQVVAVQEVRRLPAKDNFPEAAVDHLTLSANGSQVLVTMFRKVSEPLPDVGSTVEGELGDADRFDKDRRKFIRPRSGGGGGGGFRKRDPSESRRIERQHAQHMALLYVNAKIATGQIKGFTWADVTKLADAFDRDLSPGPPPSDVPADTEGLPPPSDIESDDGENIPF